jgi:hypothetical protein
MKPSPRILAAKPRPSFAGNTSLKKIEGAGNAGRWMHPQPRVRVKKAHELVTTGTAIIPAFPARMVLTAYFALSPVIGLCCHRRRRDAMHRRQLDASVEASRPHDFAVRSATLVNAEPQRPSHPIPTFVTIAIRPSLKRWNGTDIVLIWVNGEAKYFFNKDWTGGIALMLRSIFDFARRTVGRVR